MYRTIPIESISETNMQILNRIISDRSKGVTELQAPVLDARLEP